MQTKQEKDFKKVIESSKGRTLEVRKNMALNLLPHLKKIAEHCEHSDAKVCKEVVHACSLILMRSPTSLKEGLGPLLDAVVSLSVNENDEVRNESISTIRQLTEFFSHQNGYDFLQLAEENFYMLLTRLPRIVQKDGMLWNGLLPLLNCISSFSTHAFLYILLQEEYMGLLQWLSFQAMCSCCVPQ